MAASLLSLGIKAQSLQDGVKMYKYERYQSAEKILMPLAPGNALANYYFGLSQLAQGDINGAQATFNKYPQDVANMAGLARVAFAQKNMAQGTQIAAAVAAKGKKKEWEPWKYAADAITYSDEANTQQNIQQAIEWYKKALDGNDNADLRLSLGDAYEKIQDGGDAENGYEAVAAKDPKNTFAYTHMGSLWYAAKNYPLALENYSKAKMTDPANPLPYHDLALAYELVGNYDSALNNIQKYYDLSDKSPDDEASYMDILFLSKHYSEAINKANMLMARGVKNPRFNGILAYSQLETHDSVNALKNVRLYFAQQNPKKIYQLDYLNYANILLANGMNDSANYYFNKSVVIDTSRNKSDAYRKIAESFKNNKEYSKSAEWYSRLISEYPETHAIDYFWGVVMYFYAKDYVNADAKAAKFEEKYPDEASSTYWHARVKAAIDNEAKVGDAVPYFTKWLNKVGPNYDKKNDMKIAYEYLLLYYYNKSDKENIKDYEEKIRAIDPSDALMLQIEGIEKRAGTPKPAAHTKPVAKPR